MAGTLCDVLGEQKKHSVMNDTWGHLFPEPGSKHRGYLIIVDSELSGQTILASEFPTLNDSPQRCELERATLDMFEWHQRGCVVYRLDCTFWFYKTSNSMYLGKPIGKAIKANLSILERFI